MDALKKEALKRLEDARKCKSFVEQDIRECYFFIAPDRCRDITSMTDRSGSNSGTSKFELQTSIGLEVAEDFVNEVLEGFIPESAEWMDQRLPVGLDPDVISDNDLEEKAKMQTSAILGRMKETNFYSELAQNYKADLPVGTVAMWVDNTRLGEPTSSRSVPLRELEINVGPDGQVDDRFVVRHTMLRHLPSMISKGDIDDKLSQKIQKEPDKKCCVVWGFWRKWEETGFVWQGVVLLDNEVLAAKNYNGEGSIPLIVTRFDPDPMYAFGFGPSRKALPEFRQADEMKALQMESYDFKVHPPFLYPDDGVINFANGIEPGMGYPARLGPGQEPRSLMFDSNLQYEEYAVRDIEQRIRRMHYVDYPEQRGKTPPTAAQWLDEMAMRQRRLGRPGKSFWAEGPRAYFMRFRYLLEQEGAIEAIKINGQPLPLTPYNPTEKAKDHADVMTANQFLTVANQAFPQVAQVAIDGVKTLQNIKKAMRDKLVVVREETELKQTIETLAPVLGAAAGGDVPVNGDVQ